MGSGWLDREITYLKGVGERRAKVLKQELQITTWRDLLDYFPYRHVDRTQILKVNQLRPNVEEVQLQGVIRGYVEEGTGRKRRLRGYFCDDTGEIELVWFNSVQYVLQHYKVGVPYTIFGKPKWFGNSWSITHPEVESVSSARSNVGLLYPMYNTSEKMKRAGLTSRALADLQRQLLESMRIPIPETLPEYLVAQLNLPSRDVAIRTIHFPRSEAELQRAVMRLKMEEIFFIALKARLLRYLRKSDTRGFHFPRVGNAFSTFYHEQLPFELTGAQKRVVREIHTDMQSGHQMNRLLQGDVGSGKTIVALLAMLLAVDNGYQACMMAPTEILAQQHAQSLTEMLKGQGVHVALLIGSMRKKAKEEVVDRLKAGEIDILVGTHILIEEYVQFKSLGLAVIDEQHRFGVYQRSVLWEKSRGLFPHILIMSATPIPRTLAMTMYGDLDVSILDELPPGRTPIVTSHVYDKQRTDVYRFIHQQIMEGRQAYMVYPIIDESDKMDLESLTRGYEDVSAAFPAQKVGVVHGQQKPAVKDREMELFVSGESNILVATTVIEVGVNVPNATVMLINNAERFGLAQLHQLRGRVGRGSKQSYCILLTSDSISETARKKVEVMCRSTDGFYIAEEDLKLRGFGDIDGTAQTGSGVPLKIADLAQDTQLVQFCGNLVDQLLAHDPTLSLPDHTLLRQRMSEELRDEKDWSSIS